MAKTTTRDSAWFDTDRAGLRKLVERKGKAFLVFELLQNAWDEKSTEVVASLQMVPGQQLAQLQVLDDNPDGFHDLKHAYTLFAESSKKGNSQQRGRFNLGEKLVLACCSEAKVISTKGGLIFNASGRHKTSKKLDRGTMFEASVHMTRTEFGEACAAIGRLMPPQDITTRFNGELLQRPTPVATFEAALPTEIAGDDGALRKTVRTTTVEVFEPKAGETAAVYEMGIPVVETGDRFHINVMQKVPLNFERDNVTPAYLRTLRTLVLNQTSHLLTKEEVTSNWVQEASTTRGLRPRP
jgi:hypothetical protein